MSRAQPSRERLSLQKGDLDEVSKGSLAISNTNCDEACQAASQVVLIPMRSFDLSEVQNGAGKRLDDTLVAGGASAYSGGLPEWGGSSWPSRATSRF